MHIIIFFFLFGISLLYFCHSLIWRVRYIRLGKAEKFNSDPLMRWKFLLRRILLQEKIREFPLTALFHSFIFWGFWVLGLSSFDMAAFFLFGVHLPFIGDSNKFLLIRDIFLILTLGGVIGFTARRLYIKESWLHSSYKAYGLLWLIGGIVLTELLYVKVNISGAKELFWWLHYLFIFSFFFIIPNTKHLHLIFAPFNVYWHSAGTKGTLPKPADLTPESEQNCGIKTIDDFTRKQLLDTFSCVLCGRCHKYCPSERSKEWLKPKRLNGFIRTYLEKEGRELWLAKKKQADACYQKKVKPKKIVGDLFKPDFIWCCTTCGACNNVCPMSIDHLSKISGMRRSMISEKTNVPVNLQQVFQGIENHGNPFGIQRSEYPDYLLWAKKLGVATFNEKPSAEYLFFFGCQSLFTETARSAASAMVKIMQAAGIDFVILAETEWCCGDQARRTGNERLYQKVVHHNIAMFNRLEIEKIITICPHCYNTFKNEYPQFGGSWKVISHTALIAELIAHRKLNLNNCTNIINFSGKIRVTYHDPCYLSHYNYLTEEPRYILDSLPGIEVVEMSLNKENSFCCGAGGGRFWSRLEQPNPITRNRAAQTLLTDASVLVTSCPYCNSVFREELANSGQKQKIIVRDIAEMISF